MEIEAGKTVRKRLRFDDSKMTNSGKRDAPQILEGSDFRVLC